MEHKYLFAPLLLSSSPGWNFTKQSMVHHEGPSRNPQEKYPTLTCPKWSRLACRLHMVSAQVSINISTDHKHIVLCTVLAIRWTNDAHPAFGLSATLIRATTRRQKRLPCHPEKVLDSEKYCSIVVDQPLQWFVCRVCIVNHSTQWVTSCPWLGHLCSSFNLGSVTWLWLLSQTFSGASFPQHLPSSAPWESGPVLWGLTSPFISLYEMRKAGHLGSVIAPKGFP